MATSIEHFNPPEGSVGVHSVDVEEQGRCLDATVHFWDTRDLEKSEEVFWVPRRVVDLEYGGIDEKPDPEDLESPVSRHEKNPQLWKTGEWVADTPAPRGILAELKSFGRWAERSITSRGCYLASLIHAYRTLWD